MLGNITSWELGEKSITLMYAMLNVELMLLLAAS